MRLITLSLVLLAVFSLGSEAKEIANLQEVIKKANNGDSSSQSDLIDYYYNRIKNYDEAISYCELLLNNSNAEEHNKEYANRILGLCAEYGTGMPKSLDNAVSYFKNGIELKGPSSAYSLAKLYEREMKDSVEAINCYRESAELGDKGSMLFLGELYEKGFIENSNKTKTFYPDVKKDISQAAKFYDLYIDKMGHYRGAAPINSQLLYKVGQWYYEGEGNMEKNFTKAFNYLDNAIKGNENSSEDKKLTKEEMGNALWCLSVCYRFGRGTDKDELQARRYVKRAAEIGNQNAISLLNQ